MLMNGKLIHKVGWVLSLVDEVGKRKWGWKNEKRETVDAFFGINIAGLISPLTLTLFPPRGEGIGGRLCEYAA
jgi:hypothetical protein